MPVDPQHTQIKETAYTLAKKFGWALEYNGGLELDGEFLDDADLSTERTEDGVTMEYVLNLSYADSTAYGFTLTREDIGGQLIASTGFDSGASFSGAAASISGDTFGAGSFATGGIPGENAVTLAEKYYITTVAELVEAIETKLEALGI